MYKSKIDWCGSSWNPVPEHDGYFASADGRILSLKKREPRILKPIRAHDGHLYVFMYNDGVMKKVWVHRAVLSAYRGKEEGQLLCRHLDDNPENNCIDNLEWGSYADNSDDRRRNKGFPGGEASPRHKLNDKKVMEIRERYSNGESSQDLGFEFGVAKSTILAIVRGDKWKYLPIVPIREKHPSIRKTPNTSEQQEKSIAALKKYNANRKKPRKEVLCACGCGRKLTTPDEKGRDRKYIQGHNALGRHWRWKKNVQDKDTVL